MRFYALLLSFLLFHAPSAMAQEIYLSTLSNQLFRLNLTDCSYQQVGAIPFSTTDISFHPNGNLYAVNSSGRLYQIDVLNGTSSLIHAFESNASQTYTALTCSATGIFYACGLGGDLWAYNLATNTGQFLGNTGYGAEGDLAFYEGALYMAAQNDDIVRVDIQNPSNSTVIIDENVNGRIFGIVTYAANCESLTVYSLTESPSAIYEVNFANNSLDFYQHSASNEWWCQPV
ncbi:MAG: hypothetical protein R2795_02910 [Saprospiraceae bacterium]